MTVGGFPDPTHQYSFQNSSRLVAMNLRLPSVLTSTGSSTAEVGRHVTVVVRSRLGRHVKYLSHSRLHACQDSRRRGQDSRRRGYKHLCPSLPGRAHLSAVQNVEHPPEKTSRPGWLSARSNAGCCVGNSSHTWAARSRPSASSAFQRSARSRASCNDRCSRASNAASAAVGRRPLLTAAPRRPLL